MDKRKVMMIEPRSMKIEIEETIVSFGVDLPTWWRKFMVKFNGTDGHANYFLFKPGFMDHAGIIPERTSLLEIRTGSVSTTSRRCAC